LTDKQKKKVIEQEIETSNRRIEQGKDTQSRKYQLTINNPLDVEIEGEKGTGVMVKLPFHHERVKECLRKLTAIDYWCMADEIGISGETPHTHIYFVAHSPIRFSTVKKLFPTAHIESAYGTSQENRDYITKSGKHKEKDGKKTSVGGTFEEWGEIPTNERMGRRGEQQYIFDMIQSGLSDAEILKAYAGALPHLRNIDHAGQTLVEEEYRNAFRELEVIYIFGKTETGKTRNVMEKHGYSNVYRITDYLHPWDSYDSIRHKVVIFEEFRSSLRIRDMLNYLDGYPCELPARYRNRVATYRKAYLITNIPLEKQYRDVQEESPETWQAFLRRIQKVLHYRDDTTIVTYDSVTDYLNRDAGFRKLTNMEQQQIPWK
jgi:hypothetical protein